MTPIPTQRHGSDERVAILKGMHQPKEESAPQEVPEPMCETLKRRSQAARKAKLWQPEPPSKKSRG
jgi:hypothetical protein